MLKDQSVINPLSNKTNANLRSSWTVKAFYLKFNVTQKFIDEAISELGGLRGSFGLDFSQYESRALLFSYPSDLSSDDIAGAIAVLNALTAEIEDANRAEYVRSLVS